MSNRGIEIKNRRIAQKIEQSDLARWANMDESILIRIEKGLSAENKYFRELGLVLEIYERMHSLGVSISFLNKRLAIKQWSKKYNITLSQLADLLGTTPTHITNILNGNTSKFEEQEHRKICALHKDFMTILKATKDDNP